MKANKSTLILFGILAVAIFMIIQSKFKENELQRKLHEIEEKENNKNEIISQNRLLHIDSMLIKGDYNSALEAYKEESTFISDDDTFVKIRIELAQQFMKLSRKSKIDTAASLLNNNQINDSVSNKITINQLNTYDSLSFILEKTKVQLERLKNQLKNKTLGKYLTFTNRKKHQLHYVGEVIDNKADGYGVALFDTGSRYVGNWNDNLRHGEGSFYWNDGQYYIGEYKNDKRSGQGTYYWKNGEKYVGQWENDQRNGQGTFYDKKGGVITSGIWKNDKLSQQEKKK